MSINTDMDPTKRAQFVLLSFVQWNLTFYECNLSVRNKKMRVFVYSNFWKDIDANIQDSRSVLLCPDDDTTTYLFSKNYWIGIFSDIISLLLCALFLLHGSFMSDYLFLAADASQLIDKSTDDSQIQNPNIFQNESVELGNMVELQGQLSGPTVDPLSSSIADLRT